MMSRSPKRHVTRLGLEKPRRGAPMRSERFPGYSPFLLGVLIFLPYWAREPDRVGRRAADAWSRGPYQVSPLKRVSPDWLTIAKLPAARSSLIRKAPQASILYMP